MPVSLPCPPREKSMTLGSWEEHPGPYAAECVFRAEFKLRYDVFLGFECGMEGLASLAETWAGTEVSVHDIL